MQADVFPKAKITDIHHRPHKFNGLSGISRVAPRQDGKSPPLRCDNMFVSLRCNKVFATVRCFEDDLEPFLKFLVLALKYR